MQIGGFESYEDILDAHSHHHGCNCLIAPRFAQLVDRSWMNSLAVYPTILPSPVAIAPILPSMAAGSADTVLTGKIITMNPIMPRAEAVAIRDGRVIGVGSVGAMEGLKGPDTQLLDFGDQAVLPGFVEPHMHYWASAMFSPWVDVSTREGRSHKEVLEALAKAKPIDGWIMGRQYDPSLVPGMPDLTRDELDKIHPDKPVFVMNASMHWAYVNSKALEAAGVSDDTPDPKGGSYGRKDGRLTGTVGEIAAMKPFLAKLPKLDRDQLEDALITINKAAAAAGYTRTHDAGTGGLFGAREPHVMYDLRDRLHVRVSMALLDQAAEKIIETGVGPGFGDDKVRVVHWKIIGDGSNQGFSGYQKENYLHKDFRGHGNYSPDDMVERMKLAIKHGFPIMVHANGDAAIAQAVSCYGKALGGKADEEARHRIEHCSFPTEDNLQDMAKLGLSPSFLVGHVYYWGKTFEKNIMGEQKAQRLDPIGSAVRLGLRCTTHSDYTVTNFEPLREMQTAMTRSMRAGGALNAEQAISLDEALKLKTSHAAWQVHADDEGRIEVGNKADFTVLEKDPYHVPIDEIADLKVASTIVGGKSVYDG